jgi:hypothetical protein
MLMLVKSQDVTFQSLTFSVTEGEPRQTFVGNVGLGTNVFYPNPSGEEYKFEIFDPGSAAARLFTLEEQTGVIRTNITLDREAVCGSSADCTQRLNIGVYKRTSPSGSWNMFLTVEVVVRILDQNDNAPEFLQKVVTLTIPENMPAPYSLYTSVATDPDMVGPNSDITYSFEASGASDKFKLEVNTVPTKCILV